jgi:hypothetical protein
MFFNPHHWRNSHSITLVVDVASLNILRFTSLSYMQQVTAVAEACCILHGKETRSIKWTKGASRTNA